MRTLASAPAQAAVQRLVSLDVFRGLTMAAMVIVNNPGDWNNVYAPLLHATWHGWTPTDLIFPFFLFIVGVSITLSRRSANWATIARRAAIIFVLGLFLAGYPRFDLATWRIPGVLQRIAVCYFVVAGLYHVIVSRRRADGSRTGEDVVVASLAFGLAVVYWGILMLVPPPGGMAGDLSPEGNLGAHIDRALFGRHIWRPRWDPEGLLSTIPAISTTLFGLLAGMWLRTDAPAGEKARRLLVAGVIMIGLGLLWSTVFPINKNLWTSSFAVFTAGAASVLLGASYWAIDVRGWRGWTKPFVVLGTNAIVLYVVSGVLADTLGIIRATGADGARVSLARYLYLSFFLPLASPKNASLLYAFAHLAVLFVLLAWLYRRRIFLRV